MAEHVKWGVMWGRGTHRSHELDFTMARPLLPKWEAGIEAMVQWFESPPLSQDILRHLWFILQNSFPWDRSSSISSEVTGYPEAAWIPSVTGSSLL